MLCTDQHRLVRALFRGRHALHLDDDFHGAATRVDDVTAKTEVAAGVERVEHVETIYIFGMGACSRVGDGKTHRSTEAVTM